MQLPDAAEVARCRAVVVSTLPQLLNSSFEALSGGVDVTCLACDGWIFRVARTVAGASAMQREVALLDYLRPRLTMALPRMVMQAGPSPFTQHAIIAGAPLTAEYYGRLHASRRDVLAFRLAQFYTELHALPLARVQAAGALPTPPSMAPDDLLALAEPLLIKRLGPFVRRSIKAYRQLSIAGEEQVFGYFNGDGRNFAIDGTTGLLNGLYDFAHAGFGSRHRDLSLANRVSPDLALRIIGHYEQLARRSVDRNLVMLYRSIQLLVDLVDGPPDSLPARQSVRDWDAVIAGFRKSGFPDA